MSKPSSAMRTIGTVMNVVGTTVGIYFGAIRPWHLKWGATEQDVKRSLPGDDRVPAPKLNATHAITIRAPVDQVWAWLIQIGQGRGGFYSYEFIENWLGADIHNANRILPEYQNLKVGDTVPLASNGIGMPVALLEANKTLVLHGDTRTDPNAIPGMKPGDFFNVVWGWHLDPIGDHTTHLVERWRVDWNPSVKNWIYMRLFLEPGAFIMSRKMLLGIKQRAETNTPS